MSVSFDARYAPIFEENFEVPVGNLTHGPGGEVRVDIPDDIRAVAAYGVAQAIATEPLDPEMAREINAHLRMLHNLEQFIADREAGMDASELHEYQQDVFHSIANFLANPPQEEDGEYIRRGYIRLPTGTGKTAIFTTLVDVLNTEFEEGGKKLRSLVLVPRLDLVVQTVGESDDENERGFARFAQDTSVSEYHGTNKELSGDAVVMTYRSFNKLVREGKLDPDSFDLIICDEAHNALGAQIKKSLDHYSQGKLVIGVTATTDFAENKKLEDLLPHEIHSMGLNEAIEEGFLAAVQGLAIASDSEIKQLSKDSRDFTDEELAVLIENEWRNQKAVQFAQSFVENGKQGLISCLPGENLAHARIVAEELNGTEVTDPATGERRSIRAVAIGSSTAKEDRKAIYEAFERGEIDVLTYVDMLTEGWDSTRAKFLINLRPTTSPVHAVQRLGRVLRPGDVSEHAIVVEFIDHSDRPQYTIFHGLGFDEIDQRRVYGSLKEGDGISVPFEIPNLPLDIQERLMAIDHQLLEQLIVQPEIYELPDGIVSISKFAKTMGVGLKSILNIITDLGIEPDVYLFGSGRIEGFGINQQEQEAIAAHPFFRMPLATEEIKSIYAFSEETGIGRTSIKNALDELGIELTQYRFGNNMAGYPGLTPEQASLVNSYMETFAPPVGEQVVGLNKFYREHNTSPEMVEKLAAELGIEIKTYRDGNKFITGLTTSEAEVVLAHDHFQIPEVSDAQVTRSDIKRELRMEVKKLKEIYRLLGIEEQTFRAGGIRVRAVTNDEAARVREYVSTHMPLAPEEAITLPEFRRRTGISSRMITSIMDDLGMKLPVYRFVNRRGAHIIEGLMPDDIKRIAEHPEYARRVGRQLAVEEVSLYAFAKANNVSESRLKAICEELGIEPREYIFNNTLGQGMTSEEAEQVLAHEFFTLPVATESDISVNAAAKKYFSVDPKTMRQIIEEVGLTTQRMRQRRGRIQDYISLDDIPKLAEHNLLSLPFSDETMISVYALSKEIGSSEKRVYDLASEQGLTIRPYRHSLGGKSTHVVDMLTDKQVRVLKQHPYFEIPKADESVVSLAVLSRELHTTRRMLERRIAELELPVAEYKFGGQIALGIKRDDAHQLT